LAFQFSCSCIVTDYIEAVKELTCEILELAAEGLWVPDKSSLSKVIKDVHSDSVLRINHYPPVKKLGNDNLDPSKFQNINNNNNNTIGFGEHSDPQILTILRSNNVGGLQVSTQHGLWIPVPPDPNEFYVMVGDSLQVTCFLINSIHNWIHREFDGIALYYYVILLHFVSTKSQCHIQQNLYVCFTSILHNNCNFLM